MKANELCPPPHLEAADLEGGEQTVTIERVGFAEVGQEHVIKGVVYFKDVTRGLVLNRTNTKKITAMHGNETDDWAGKEIVLYPSLTDFQGREVPCIRVKGKDA